MLLLSSPSQLVVCKFILYFVNGPPWVLAPYQSLPEVLQLLTEKLWSSAYSFGPMGKCTYDTVLSRGDYGDYATASTGQCEWAFDTL